MTLNYVLYGEERALLQKTLSLLIKENSGNDMMNTAIYDLMNQPLGAVLDDAQTIPFFGERKVVVAAHADFLSGGGELPEGIEALEQYLKSPMESTVLILTGDFPKLDSRKKIVKLVQKTCKVLVFSKLDDLGKANYVKEQMAKRNIRMDQAAFQELLKRLPADVGEIMQAMDKFELLSKEIQTADVEALVTRPLDDNVFDLVNAVVRKDVRQAFHLWQDLSALNKDAVYLIAMLASQFRFLYQVKSLQMQGCSEREITQQLGAHPFRVKKSLESVQNLRAQELMATLAALADLDQQIKGGKIDKDMGFELFLLRIQGDHL